MSGDLISKQNAIDAALTFLVEYCGAAFDEDMQKMLCERLDALPSAEPEPKKGKWIENKYMYYCCSECGHEAYWDADCICQKLFDFCPNCGADMRGE